MKRINCNECGHARTRHYDPLTMFDRNVYCRGDAGRYKCLRTQGGRQASARIECGIRARIALGALLMSKGER